MACKFNRNSLSTTTNKRKTNVFSGGSGDNSGQVDAVYLYRSAKIDKKKVPYDVVMQGNRALIQNENSKTHCKFEKVVNPKKTWLKYSNLLKIAKQAVINKIPIHQEVTYFA